MAAALWSIAVGADSFIGSYRLSLRLYNILLLAAQLMAIGWFVLALEITNQAFATRRALSEALEYLVARQSLVWTSSIHHLVLGAETRIKSNISVLAYGPGLWVFSGFAYALVTTGVTRLSIEAAQTTGIRRRQTVLLALAATPAVIFNVASIVFVAPVPYDLAPFSYLLTMAVLAVGGFGTGFSRYRPWLGAGLPRRSTRAPSPRRLGPRRRL